MADWLAVPDVNNAVKQFAEKILKMSQDHCKLVSKSAILRVDMGIEVRMCKPAERSVTIQALTQHISDPVQKVTVQRSWHLGCLGNHPFICRVFLNEVSFMVHSLASDIHLFALAHAYLCLCSYAAQLTSTTDINWFSAQVNYPVITEAATSILEVMMHVADEQEHYRIQQSIPSKRNLPIKEHRNVISVPERLEEKMPQTRHECTYNPPCWKQQQHSMSIDQLQEVGACTDVSLEPSGYNAIVMMDDQDKPCEEGDEEVDEEHDEEYDEGDDDHED